MSSKPANYTPTAFPRLDTLATGPLEIWSRSCLYLNKRNAYVHGPHSRSGTALLEQYSHFIAAFTGESEICYAFRCTPITNAVTASEAFSAVLDCRER